MFDSPFWLTLQWWGKLAVELILLGIALGVSYLIGAFVVDYVRGLFRSRRKTSPVGSTSGEGEPPPGTRNPTPVDPATSPRKDRRPFFALFWQFLRELLLDNLFMKYARRGMYFAAPVEGHGTIIVKQGAFEFALLSDSGPRSQEYVALANQRNAQYIEDQHRQGNVRILHRPKEESAERDADNNPVLIDQHRPELPTLPPPLKDDSVAESQRLDEAVRAVEKQLDAYHVASRKYDADLIRLNPHVKDLPFIVRGSRRGRSSLVWMGLPSVHWVYGHRAPNYVGLFVDGLPTTINMQDRLLFVQKQSAVLKRDPKTGEYESNPEKKEYVPETPSEDGIATNASETIIVRVHDLRKATFVLKGGIDPEKLTLALLNITNPSYREAVATLRWDAVVRDVEARILQAEHEFFDQLKDAKQELRSQTRRQVQAAIDRGIQSMIQKQINVAYRVRLGIIREVKTEEEDKYEPGHKIVTARYVDWNTQSVGGATIHRYPETNTGVLARMQYDYGLYVSDVKVQDIEPDRATQMAINDLIKSLFTQRATIIAARGSRERLKLEGEGRGAAEKAELVARAEGWQRQMQDLKINDGTLVLQADTARHTYAGAGTKIIQTGSDPAGLLGALTVGAQIVKGTTDPDAPKDAAAAPEPKPSEPNESAGEDSSPATP